MRDYKTPVVIWSASERFERSGAVEPFDRLRAGFWNVWNGPRY
jgi:hypothetical protein